MTLTTYDLRTDGRRAPREIDNPTPRFQWRLRTTLPGDDQREVRVRVVRRTPAGAPVETWNTGWVVTSEVEATYAGTPLVAFCDYEWNVEVRGDDGLVTGQSAVFETGAMRCAELEGAWIGRSTEFSRQNTPVGVEFERSWVMQMADSALRVRRGFHLPDRVLRARLFASAHGVYLPYVNGARVGDFELAPGWTDYEHRVQYQSYDVTELLTTGDNTVGIIVGDGWWSGCVGYDVRRHARHYGTRPHAWAQLVIDLANGRRVVLATDETWEERGGEIVYSDLLMGEAHDLTILEPDWCDAGAPGDGWRSAVTFDRDMRRLVGQIDEPVGVIEVRDGVVVERSETSAVVDFGQNLVGRVRLRLSGVPRGHVVRVHHAEVLDGGRLYRENLRSAEAVDIMVAPGGTFDFEPNFTFHGFRFAELVGLPRDAVIETASAVVLSSRLPVAGTVTTSDASVNRLLDNIEWSRRGNFLSVPTDCPQRDERLGWTADAQVFAPTATYLVDASAFFSRWLRDLADAQLENGSVPDVIPLPPPAEIFDFGAAGWGDAATVIPWHLYERYGDVDTLRRQYPSMRAWVDYVTSRNAGGLWETGLGNGYGDWLSVGEVTDHVLVATAYRAHSIDVLVRAARVLGEDADAATYVALGARVREAFASRFIADGRLSEETQTGYLMALAWGLVPDDHRDAFAERLVALIESRGRVLATGFLGVALLCPTLTAIGRSDLAYDLLLQRSYPSWLYSIDQGATTIWERWDGWTEHAGFQAASMNSFNHYSLGSVGEWVFAGVAGLAQTPGDSGFRDITFAPQFDERLSSASATYQAVRGEVAISWRRERDHIAVTVVIPPGATGRADFLPGRLRLGSGRHEFTVAIAETAGMRS